MGRIARLLSFTRALLGTANVSEAKVDPGGGANVSAYHFAAPGDDSNPLPDDAACIVDIPGRGRFASVGYADPKNAGVAARGEKRIYARDSNGAIVGYFWLKNDGTIWCANLAGSFTMQPGGSVVINGVTITPSGDIQTAGKVEADTVEADTVEADTSLKVATKEVNGHTHGGVTPGAGTTGPF